MNSQTLPQFWKLYYQLPKHVRRQASKSYRIWQQHPDAASLNFKRVGRRRPVCSIRIGDYYRALGLLLGDTVTWFWIGNHDKYE